MSLERTKFASRARICLLLALGATPSAWAAFTGITNGDFSSNTITGAMCGSGVTAPCNMQFDSNYAAGSGVVTGWTATGYSIYFVNGKQSTQNAVGQWSSSGKEMLDAAASGKASPTGGNFVALDADPTIASSISQTLNGLTIGTTYYLSYYWAAAQLQSRTGVTSNYSVQVSLGSTVRNSVNTITSLPSAGFNGWFRETTTFVATSTTQTLTFLGKSTSTCLPPMILLDGITMSTPEPGTMSLMAAGLFLVAVSASRRRKSKP